MSAKARYVAIREPDLAADRRKRLILTNRVVAGEGPSWTDLSPTTNLKGPERGFFYLSVNRLTAVAEQMNPRKLIWRTCAALAVAAGAGFVAPSPAGATLVRFSTDYGNIDVRLYNTATPLSVANFVNYVNSGRFAESIIHRSVPGFIIQGGGFYYPTPSGNLAAIPTDPPVLNEFGISNLRGTLAYAKLGADPPTQQSINSATSGWFFNLANNASNLDNQNGGFTVFGRVVGTGMTVVDTIAGLSIVNAGSPFDNLPVVNLAAVQKHTVR